jgi:hypothetical protein
MLQVFDLNVVKIDLDVSYVAMVIHACFKRMFVLFRYFKNKSGEAHGGRRTVACHSRLLLLLGRRLGSLCW